MLPSSQLPAKISISTKTHKFDNLNELNVKTLKLRPIIDQTGTYYYKIGEVISQYLKLLQKMSLLSPIHKILHHY